MEQAELRQTLPGKQGGFDAYTLKIIAIIGMTLDHFAIVFDNYLPLWAKCVLYTPGGLTFPIMALLLCEGYRYTRSVPKYILRMLIFAAIAQVPYMWGLMSQANVLFTFVLCLLALLIADKVKSPLLSMVFLVLLMWVSIFFDWGIMAVPMVLLYNYVTDKKMKVMLPVFIPILLTTLQLLYAASAQDPAIFLELLPSVCFTVIGCTATIPLLYRYNGQRGKKSRNPQWDKYTFYVYYPLHIVVLVVLRGLLFGVWGSPF